MSYFSWATCTVKYPSVRSFCTSLTAPYGDCAVIQMMSPVRLCVSEWRSSVQDLGGGRRGAEVQQHPLPGDRPRRQPGSGVLWERQSGVPVTSVCQPQNHCALWVKNNAWYSQEHTHRTHKALAALAAMDYLGYGHEVEEYNKSLTSKTNSFAVPA